MTPSTSHMPVEDSADQVTADGRDRPPRTRRSTRARVPELLATTGAWAWRLLAVGVVAYLAAWLINRLSVVTVPIIIAALITALVAPARDALQRAGLSRLWASWLTFLAAVAIFLGVLGFAVYQATTSLPRLMNESSSTLAQIRGLLARAPLGLGSQPLQALGERASNWLQSHRQTLFATVYTGADLTLRVLVGVLLTAVLTFLLLYDGDRIWGMATGLSGPRWSGSLNAAGRVAWHTLSGYVHATLLIASFHGVVIGTTLALLHVPLAMILAVLVFIGSFVPIAGVVVAGGLAVLVAFATGGPLDGGIVLGMLIFANQVESHLLQPLVMRRFVHVHPIVTVIGIAALGSVWGVPGALVAVPSAAIVHQVWPVLRGQQPEHPDGAGARGEDEHGDGDVDNAVGDAHRTDGQFGATGESS